jgi:hypothetical protein
MKLLMILNTQLNGKFSKKDECLDQIIKRMAEIKHEESNPKCEMCERATFSNSAQFG